MTFNYNFYKTPENRWYIDIPAWTGSNDELEMVSGADTLLDILSQGEGKINLSFSDKSINESIVLKKIKDTPEIGGALYNLEVYCGIDYNLEIWLCSVTEWIFGYLPNTIYVI